MLNYKTPFVSIIVPFHNAANKCAALLQTLRTLRAEDGVELIFVDDGSTDNTLRILREFAQNSPSQVCILERSNGGPGAARNLGLAEASGQFIWFVDSDDDIDLDVFPLARKTRGLSAVDVIVWEFDHPNIRSSIPPGLHGPSSRLGLTEVFDPIVANWFSMPFLKQTGVQFPEYCIYEATPIEAFVLPLLVRNYFKSDFIAYKCNLDNPSVTRSLSRTNARFYDRLETVSLGLSYLQETQLGPSERPRFDADFVRLFLWYSIRLSKVPNLSWVRAARVMRKFRDEARRFKINDDPFLYYGGRHASRFVLRVLWILSGALPSQEGYFRRRRMRTWGRPISWQRPIPPQRCASPIE